MLAPVHPLALEGVSKSYTGVRALAGLDLVVEAGSIWGLVGPNGSGKTTALRVVAGLVEPDSGRVAVNGHERGTIAARRSLALVPDEPGGLDELTVAEFVALYRALYGAGDGYDARAARLLELFGLAPRARTQLAALSHGMRRQVGIVTALALATPALVVDEATATLDPEAVIVLREALRARARAGSGVLLATQDLHFAETICDGVVLLSRGATVASGPLRAILADYRAPTLEHAFLAALGRASLAVDLRESLDAL